MVSDFFFPNCGGVEEHIYNLSQCLLLNGHKVILITHSYGDRKGIRYMTNGLKVYYLPIKVFYNQCILPTMICSIPILRDIFIREKVDIVHGHSAFSALAHEAMQIGVLMGTKAIFTDHSLFGFADLSAVVTNKFLQISLAFCNHCICVSHTGKENTVLRAKVKAENVSVIPNAVNSAQFTPNPINRPKDANLINIVIVSRLVYRKGIDLLAGIIPYFKEHPNVNFIIAGDGPKRELLEEIREKNNMQDRVQMLGSLEHSDVRDVLTRGHIFLNTSLTEAYCMAIVEAASTGLHIVSTKVGGVPEVLPEDLNVILTKPDTASLILALEETIARYRKFKSGQFTDDNANMCPFVTNKTVASLYNWNDVTRRTEKIYNKVMKEQKLNLHQIMANVMRSAVFLYMLVISLCYLLLKILDWLVPKQTIDICKNFNKVYSKRTK